MNLIRWHCRISAAGPPYNVTVRVKQQEMILKTGKFCTASVTVMQLKEITI